ncbi:MAG: hypothetical protein QF712_05010 [Candidatus Marinimicrobia bacterium]|nr:hypothetical protein [Candidatus Neomarinimicrobiota bacterium]MDP7060826.1 hypothetical protein [Candidatus Neomarinimicrobiota bacterium]
MKKIKKMLFYFLLFTIACELNLGEEEARDNNGGGCEIRIGGNQSTDNR